MRHPLIIFMFLCATVFNCEQDKNIIGAGIYSDFRIVYQSEKHIYIMDRDGNNKRRLAERLNSNGYYSGYDLEDVSICRQQLLLTHYIQDSISLQIEHTTCILNLADNQIQMLSNTSQSLNSQKFSPDGSQIVFVSFENNNDIYLMNADGSNIKNLTNEQYWNWNPCFKPNGEGIVYASEGDLFSINLDGSQRTNITNDGSVSPHVYSISRDGRKIVYESRKGVEYKNNIYVINADGGKLKKLTDTGRCYNPKFSPNGKWISYIYSTYYEVEIKIMDVKGNNKKIAASIEIPNWIDLWLPSVIFAPDNRHVIYTGFENNNKDIFSVDINGDSFRNLTDNPDYEYLGLVVPIK